MIRTQPITILVTADGSVPDCCWRDQNHRIRGVIVKMKNGLTFCSIVTGIVKLVKPRLTAPVKIVARPESSTVLPDCS